MKYMLLTYLDEKAWGELGETEQERVISECNPHIENLLKNGKLLAGAPLHPTSTATTLRLQDGKRLVTDGPFAETREQLGGYTLLEADNLDEAIAIAGKFLGRSFPTAIEIRPIRDFPGTPSH
ncbi:MAG TPA: YciI family protein [Bryobacteraceae bacterium]|nr:YciI family protein [Bryobacteraceae bacterium]